MEVNVSSTSASQPVPAGITASTKPAQSHVPTNYAAAVPTSATAEHCTESSESEADSSFSGPEDSHLNNAATCPAPEELRNDLAVWGVKRKIKLDALDELLSILRHYNIPHLPKTGRSLLKTPRAVQLREVRGGNYYHFGIADSCRYGLGVSSLPVPPENTTLQLVVHIDGVSVTKSDNSEFYPILGKVVYSVGRVEHASVVFLIGLFHGDSGKPGCANDFLSDFVEDYNDVHANGMSLNGCDHMYDFKLKAVVCDAPARAFVKCMKAHGGYYGCDFCEVEGEWHRSHGVVYPDRHAALRTDQSFRHPDMTRASHAGHQHTADRSPLRQVADLDLIGDVTPEYMHTVTLGVMKRNAGLWFTYKSKYRVRGRDTKFVSERLTMCSAWCPSNFGRKPRRLHLKDKFKATEWRSMLLYTGFCILKGVLTDQAYNHHLLLACAMKILLNEEWCARYHDLADRMLRKYVKEYALLYGRDSIVYNVHQLIHLAAAAARHGNLEKIGAFAFESYMRQLRAAVRKPQATLKQVVKREFEHRRLTMPVDRSTDWKYRGLKGTGPKPANITGHYQSYTTAVGPSGRFSCVGGDGYVAVHGEGVGRIVNILRPGGQDSSPVAVVRFFREVREHFDSPLSSTHLGIARVSKLSEKVKARRLTDCRKVWFMPCTPGYDLAVELAHEMSA